MAGRGSRGGSGRRLQTGRTGLEGRDAAGRGNSPVRRPPTQRQLDAIYRALLEAYGPQQWWPVGPDGEGFEGEVSEDLDAAVDPRLEICLGAILTQNTSWRGASAALANLRAADALSCEAILALPPDALGDLVRPSGHFNVKARKLQSFASVVVEECGGSLDPLLAGDTDEVRQRLLSIWGIGPETADAITLYAARLPTFVVDAYAYRLFERLDLPPGERRYDVYREFFLDAIGPDVTWLNEWHALIVRHGQRVCRRSTPRCDECPLLTRCPFGLSELGMEEAGTA